MDLDALTGIAIWLFAMYWPLLIVPFVLVGGPLLGCVIVAVVGAVRTGISRPDETRDVDVAEFFEEQIATVGRNDSI